MTNTNGEMIMADFLVTNIPDEDLYVALSGHQDALGLYLTSGAQASEARYTYSPWHYYEKEEESTSSGNPILWGLGGLLVGALLMGLVFLFIRKKSKALFKPQPVMPAMEDAPQQQTFEAYEPVQSEAPFSRARRLMASTTAMETEGFPKEVCIAEAIPGETMDMLATRLQGSIRRAGVSIDKIDAGKILGAYASSYSVRIATFAESDPVLLKRAAKALSEFFCVSMPGSPEPCADYLPADASVPKYFRTVIEPTRLDTADWQSYGGINRETFRGILRETEEEYYVPEEEWKRVDALMSHYIGGWISPARHQMIRKMENISTCLLAVGADLDEALDYAMYQALFLRITRTISRSGMIVLGEAFNELFRDRAMPLCRNFLTDYMPTAKKTEIPVMKETETPATNTQTIHGGEYEPE